MLELPTFEMSSDITEIAKALSKSQLEMIGAVKDSSNPYFKSTYADLESVLYAAKICNKHGLSLVQIPLESDNGIKLISMLLHDSGQWIRGIYKMSPAETKPQAIGSCITYMRRYAAGAMYGIPQVDDDANAASNTTVTVAKQPKPIFEKEKNVTAQSDSQTSVSSEFLTPSQVKILLGRIKIVEVPPEILLHHLQIDGLEKATLSQFNEAMAFINSWGKKNANV